MKMPAPIMPPTPNAIMSHHCSLRSISAPDRAFTCKEKNRIPAPNDTTTTTPLVKISKLQTFFDHP
jgi:hypothetical protein